jgi:hypothetical protein
VRVCVCVYVCLHPLPFFSPSEQQLTWSLLPGWAGRLLVDSRRKSENASPCYLTLGAFPSSAVTSTFVFASPVPHRRRRPAINRSAPVEWAKTRTSRRRRLPKRAFTVVISPRGPPYKPRQLASVKSLHWFPLVPSREQLPHPQRPPYLAHCIHYTFAESKPPKRCDEQSGKLVSLYSRRRWRAS